MATGEFGSPAEKAELNAVIVQGSEVDLDAIDASFIADGGELVSVYVPVKEGKIYELKFQRLPRRAAHQEFLVNCRRQYKTLPALGTAEQKAHPWAAFWPQNAQEYIDAAAIAEFSVEPRISMEKALIWLANADLVRNIMAQLEAGSNTFHTVMEVALIEAQKKSTNQAGDPPNGISTSPGSVSTASDDSPKS